MGTNIRSEISRKSKYWISKHRYYELKHFCLQYSEWKKEYIWLDGTVSMDISRVAIDDHNISDPTGNAVEARLYFKNRIDMVEEAAKDACDTVFDGMWRYIVKSVTEDISYEKMKARYDIPCCKETWYDAYRRFFWFLSNSRK